jgi:hypothetical protein
MAETPNSEPVNHVDPEKQAQIDQIEQTNRSAFQTWADNPHNHQSLALSNEAAQHLIPRRILELASDPSRVTVALLKSQSHWLDFLILENTDELLTNPSDYTVLQEHRNSGIPLTPDERAQMKIDPMHANLSDLVDSGQIGFQDKVYLWMTLQKQGDDEVFVGQLYDNPQTRRQGIATGLYDKVRNLREVKFRFLTGENRPVDLTDPTKPGNITFFLEKLGRTRLTDLSQSMQQHFFDNHNVSGAPIEDPKLFTVDFLYPEDNPPQPPFSS